MSTFFKESFWSLLSNKGGIVIPIIQRAYTQGGRGCDAAVAKKGEKFLQYLVDALLGVTPAVELDFIYGTIENDKVQPLDGQQRLTTLFLLHWYVAQKENRLSDEVKSTLNKFSYETRASSRSFCGKLREFLVPAPDSRSLPKIIEDQGWFVLSWKNDPSVLSMLGMLDRIHNKLKDAPSTPPLWDRLTSAPAQAPITFFYTPLEAFNLTDDLYIRMNARGKELTSFEEFKAAIEKKIDDGDWDAGKPVSDTFGNQMDNEWTDLFWRFRDKHNQIDRYVLRIFAAVLIGHYAGRDNAKAVRLFNTPESLTADDLDRDSYECLYETLNLFHSAGEHLDDTVINDASFWWGDSKHVLKSFGDFFKLFIAHESETGKMTWQQLALFHGVAVYLRDNSNDTMVNFADWLRFVRNLLANGTTVDDIVPFVSAKNRLDEMAKRSGDIYGNLLGSTTAGGFARDQMAEEIRKAQIFANSPEAKPIIQKMEDCNFCRGKVTLILGCLGVSGRVDDLQALERMKYILFKHLDNRDIRNDFRRGLLAALDGMFYTYWHSWLYAVSANKRRLIEDMKDLRDFAYKPAFSHYLAALLLSLKTSELSDLLKFYQPPDDMPNWKKRLIMEAGLLENSRKHYIAVPADDSCCWLIPGSKVNNDERGRSKLIKVV
ncbi:MAG: DUF262 domain-containing protein [Candidatus Sumerlaeales bacterium]|nr:DUF262 domain-containing protein [Candidatus Sumerlaeales bacterium]